MSVGSPTSFVTNGGRPLSPTSPGSSTNVDRETSCGSLPIDMFELNTPRTQIRQPLKIGEYSLLVDEATKKRQFLNDSSELKYLHAPPPKAVISFDLTHGYDPKINWGSNPDVKLDDFLSWIKLNRKKFMVPGEPRPGDLHTDFVTYRGNFTKIMTFPYEQQEGFNLYATKYRGTIYLCHFNDDDFIDLEPDDFYNKQSFSGYRFEQYLCSPFPDQPPNPNVADTEINQFCCVIRSRVFSDHESHSYIIGAEVDAAIPYYKEPPGTLQNFVELKTSKQVTSQHQYKNFLRYRLLKWWAQCYLAGIPTILCGYKNDKLVVNEIEALQIQIFPDLAQEYWSANVCINYLNRFLSFAKKCVTIDDPRVVYQFQFKPGHDVKCVRLTTPGKYQILPQWYIREFFD